MKNIIFLITAFCLFVSSVSFAEPTTDQLATEGKVMYSEGRYQAAISVLEKAVNDRPTHGLATYYLALSYIRTGKKEQAIILLEVYLERVNQENVQLTELDKEYIPKNEDLLTYATTKL